MKASNNMNHPRINAICAILLIGISLYLGYRNLVVTPSINITTDIQEARDIAANKPLDKSKYKNKAEQIVAAGRQAMQDWAAEVRKNRQQERAKVASQNKSNKPTLSAIDLASANGQQLLAAQMDIAANAIMACQKDGNTTGPAIKSCLCQKLDCGNTVTANFVKNISEFTPPVENQNKLLECLEFTQAVMNNLITMPNRLSFTGCSGVPAKSLDAKCLANGTKKWWYCEIPADKASTVIFKTADVVNFRESSGTSDGGHVGVVTCTNTNGAGTSNDCNMVDANANRDSLVQIHPVSDYSAQPKGFFRYSPNVYPDTSLTCQLTSKK